MPAESGEYRRFGPSRHETVNMPAVRMLDDDLGFEPADDDLDIPLLDETPRAPPAPTLVESTAVRRKSSADMPRIASGVITAVQAPAKLLSSTGRMATPVDPYEVYVAFAKFGDPPATIWQSPRYAVHVLRRKRTLERELESARRRGSQDVALYEAALRTADTAAVHAGIAVICAGVSLLTLFGIALFQVVRGALLL